MKNAKLLLAMLIAIAAACPAYAVRILNPGDVVKGKAIQSTYFCYSEEEQKQITEILKMAEKIEALSRAQEAEIKNLRDALVLKDAVINKCEEQIVFLRAQFDAAQAREKKALAQIEKRDAIIARNRGRNKKSFIGGVLSGIGVLLGGRAIVVGK